MGRLFFLYSVTRVFIPELLPLVPITLGANEMRRDTRVRRLRTTNAEQEERLASEQASVRGTKRAREVDQCR